MIVERLQQTTDKENQLNMCMVQTSVMPPESITEMFIKEYTIQVSFPSENSVVNTIDTPVKKKVIASPS